MHPAQSEQKSPRQIYSLKADEAIYSAFAKYQFLTAEQARGIIGRSMRVVQNRFQVLFEAKHLNRVRESRLEPYVYFLDKEGAKRACDLGELTSPHYIQSKSRMIVAHDLEITKFHLALEKAGSALPLAKLLPASVGVLEWQQWRDTLRDKVTTPEGTHAIIPDAFFVLGNKAFFLEIVKSYESEYVGGRSNIEQKLSLYLAYKERFQQVYARDDFRVLWVLPTVKRVQMLIGKIAEEFPNRKFWFTDEASYKRDITGKIWWTPKDYSTRQYSLFEQES